MTRQAATCALAAGNTLGEGLVWCPRRQALYWTDIQAATLWRYHPATRVVDTWALPERLASLALCKNDDWLLLGLVSRLAFFHVPSGTVHPICDVEPDLPTRLNDATCDREGRFVFGTLHEPPDGETQRPIGSFYRLDADLTLHRLALDPVTIPNSLAFSPDGRTLYFCDSPRRVIQRCDYDIHGNVGEARAWVDLSGMRGVPDGSTVDAEGGLWNAQWGMGRVVRYTPDGREDLIVEVPARQPSRPALAGAALDTLYVTSAHDGMSMPQRRNDLQAGHVFAAAVAIPGLPEARFAGQPETADTPLHSSRPTTGATPLLPGARAVETFEAKK